MDKRSREQLKEILERALSLTGEAREAYLLQACDGDGAMRREVESLIEAYQRRDEFFEKSPFEMWQRMMAEQLDEQKNLDERDEQEAHSWIAQTVGGRYRIEKMLHFGNMAALFVAEDMKTQSNKNEFKRVVVKIPRKLVYTSNADARNKFRNEKEALIQIDDPRVVKIIDASGELPDRRPYLVQEFIEGQTLRQLMVDHRPSLSEIAGIIKQAGRGLSAAHQKGVTHYDINPQNIMVGGCKGDWWVKLIDFNISQVENQVSHRSTAVIEIWATRDYASPEQLMRLSNITEATDIYSLAVTAYELITGSLPFHGEGLELVQQQKAGLKKLPSELRADVPRRVDEVLGKALAYDSAKRYASAKEFGDDLALALTASKSAGRPWRAVAAILLAAALMGFVAWYISTRPEAPLVGEEAAPKPSNTPPPQVMSGPERTFTFGLDLMRMHGGKPLDGRIVKASGQEMFFNGDKFRVRFVSPQPGFLYLLNEGLNSKQEVTFIMQGTFDVKAGRPVETEWLIFDQNPGVEKFWFVFAAERVPELEVFRDAVFIPEAGSERVRTYLSQHRPADLSASEDQVGENIHVKGTGGVVAYRQELKHKKG